MANIARRTDGRWRARYRDEHGREHARHFDRKIDAQRWLETVAASLHNGTYVDPDAGRTTFADFYSQWRERQLWAPRTVLAMDLAAASVPFAELPLRSLRRSHVEQWVKQMVRRGLAPGTVHTRVNNVRAVLRGAVTDRLMAADPSAGVALPRRRRKDMAMTLPTPEQVGAVMAAAGDDFRPFIAFCAFAGLRLGEAAAVRVEDIDFLRRTLHVTRQVQPAERKSVDVRPPKYGSERVVSLPSPVVDLLAAYLTDHPATDGWLFTGTTGEPVHHNTVGFRWRSTLQSAGLPDIRLHDLRHFYASGLIAAGCDVVTVQRALGHATATTTLTTYSHLWPTAEDRTRRAAEQLFCDSCGPGADHETSTSR